ncbi:MAG: ArsR family transcriptional regulator [Thaumarchaeota archaeon]|nr:MAG: ArsR family transcriptional regulator [Nitrososphaerota archaeon]
MEEYQEIQTLGLTEKVEIISTDDDKIKSVGELLSSDSSRNILKLLFEQVLTANQIAQKTGISLPLVIYHLKKMQDLQIVRITNVGKNIKTQDTKFYTSSKFAIVILPSNLTEKAKTSKSLANSFKAIYRFGSIAIAAVATWFVSRIVNITQPNPTANVPSTTNGPVTTGANQGAANNFGPAVSTAPTTSAGQSVMRVPPSPGVDHGAAPVAAPAIHVANGSSSQANTASTTSAGQSSAVTVPRFLHPLVLNKALQPWRQ